MKSPTATATATAVDQQQEEPCGTSHPEIVLFRRKKWRELENMAPTQAVKRTR